MASRRHEHGPIDHRPRRSKTPGHGSFESITVERARKKGQLIVLVEGAPFIYDGTDLEGWVMRIAVSLDLSNLDKILTTLRRLST